MSDNKNNEYVKKIAEQKYEFGFTTNVTAFYYGIAFVVFINKRDLNNVR